MMKTYMICEKVEYLFKECRLEGIIFPGKKNTRVCMFHVKMPTTNTDSIASYGAKQQHRSREYMYICKFVIRNKEILIYCHSWYCRLFEVLFHSDFSINLYLLTQLLYIVITKPQSKLVTCLGSLFS